MNDDYRKNQGNLYSGPQKKQTWHRKIKNDRRLGTVEIFTYNENNLGRILNNITSTATSSEIDANHGENDRSRYSTNIDSLGSLNSLTPKSAPAGTKNSRSEGFWLAKHKDTNITTMMEPFSPPAAWF